MKNQDLKVGDKVILSSRSKWFQCTDNPLNVVGEVVEKGNSWVYVQWSNGGYNSYKSKDSDLILCNNSAKEPKMKNAKVTKDCFVNVEDWTHEEILKAAEVFVENVKRASIDKNDFWLCNLQEDYSYLMVLEDGTVFVGSSDDLKRHNVHTELTKEDLFNTSLTETPTIHITFDPDNLEIFESFINSWENNMRKENTTKDLIDNISHAYEILCNSEDALQALQQEVVNNRKAYEDAVEELQKSIQDKGFKVESIQTASSKPTTTPTKNFDRYSYWDVSEWTEEEIEKAADILAKEFDGVIYDLATPEGYHNLYIDEDDAVIVDSDWNLESSERAIGKEFTQRTKQDIL